MNTKKLLQSGLIYTLGNLLVQGLSFITLPIYTRILSQEVFGQFNLYSSWGSIISLFIGLQLSGSFSVARIKYENNYDDYAVNIFTLANVFFVVVFSFVYIFRDYISQVLEFSSLYVLIMFIQSYFSFITGFFASYFIQLQKSVANFLLSIFNALVNVIISISLVYYIDNDFFARVLGQLFPASIVAIIAFVYFYRKKNVVYKKEYILFGLSISIPLIFHHLGHNILNQFDRIMIGKMLGNKEVALYSFGYNLGLVIQIVLNSINMAWIPWFFDARKKKVADLNLVINKYLSLGLFLTLGYLTIFPELAYLMGGAKYLQSINFISLIIISYFFVFLYTFPVNIQFFYENTKYIPFGTLFAGLVNVVLNFIFISKWGIYGAAIATIISYLSLLILHHIISKKLYNYRDVSVFMYVKLIFVASFYSFLMNYFVSSLIIRWSFGIVVLICYFVVYREYVLFLFNKYIRRSNNG